MSDIFQEVDEEVRRERLKQLWDRHGNVIIAAAVVVVVAIAGWRTYQWWEAKRAAEAGAAFEAAADLANEGKHAEAEVAFAKIATEGTAGYRVLARFRAAAELAQSDPKAAVKAYDDLSAGSVGPVLQDLAAVRAGLLLVDTAPYEELRARLEPLTSANRTFHHTARELLALAAWRAGDVAATRRWADLIVTDAETPPATRSRVDMLMALIAGDGKS
jgi:hypothetical protein